MGGALSASVALATVLLWAAPAPARVRSGVDWPTYGYDTLRSGYNPNETALGTGNVGTLQKLWSFDLGAVTIMQPVFASGVLVDGTPTDIVYIGAEHGTLFALNADTGTVVWQKFIGAEDTDCHDIPDTIFGVSGAPTLDRANNRLFVVGGDGKLYSLDLSTGVTTTGWPVAITPDPTHEHTYGGVTVWNGKAYVEIASYCDFAPYHGKVVEVDVATAKRVAAWYPAGRSVSGGGIWGPGGVSVDPTTSDVFAATGNALTSPEWYRLSEHVVELNSSLKVLGANYPGLTGVDVDFGATPLLYQPPGCPLMVAAKNKSGVLVTYTAGSLGNGPDQRLQIANVGDWQFNGIPAYSPATNMVYIGNSSDSDQGTYRHGMVALKVQPDCSLALAWQTSVGPNFASVSPPTVANGVVYYGDGIGNQEFAFDATTGLQLWNSGSTITGSLYAAPIVVNGRLYVGSWDHMFYAFAPQG